MEHSLKIFIIQSNPYHHYSHNWFNNLDNEDIIYLDEMEYFLLEKRFNLWERINKALSEDTGYMGGPIIWEDTWINNFDELFRVKQTIQSLINELASYSEKELKMLKSIFNLVNKAFVNEYWLVFDF